MKKKVTFKNRTIDMAGELYFPGDFDESKKYAAIVCVHPGSSVKEQTAGIYAAKMAERGFITLAFDASYQGESGGEPRYIEEPTSRVRDVSSAVDYLVTLDYVDAERIGVLGVCAGGGYAVNAAMTDHRMKAVGTVVGANIGRLYREGDPVATLEAVGKQRTAEVRGVEPMIVNWIPNTQEEAKQQGATDIDVVEAVDYYRTPRGEQPTACNKLRFISMASVIAFDAFHLVEKLLSQPLQIIVGDKQGAFGSYKDGHELFERATVSADKNLLVIKGASHYDLYDIPEYVDQAVERLTVFYTKNLK